MSDAEKARHYDLIMTFLESQVNRWEPMIESDKPFGKDVIYGQLSLIEAIYRQTENDELANSIEIMTKRLMAER